MEPQHLLEWMEPEHLLEWMEHAKQASLAIIPETQIFSYVKHTQLNEMINKYKLLVID